MIEFEVNGTAFRYERLDAITALGGLQVVSGLFAPMIAKADSADDPDFVSRLANELSSSLAYAVPLAKLFAPACKVEWQGKWVKLEPFMDPVFKGKPADTLTWIVECVTREYGDFLDGSGLAQIGQVVGNLFTSPTGSTGTSGE